MCGLLYAYRVWPKIYTVIFLLNFHSINSNPASQALEAHHEMTFIPIPYLISYHSTTRS